MVPPPSASSPPRSWPAICRLDAPPPSTPSRPFAPSEARRASATSHEGDSGGPVPPLPPGNLYEYQKKRLAEFAILKCLIVNEMSISEQKGRLLENGLEKRKTGSSSRTPSTVTYKVKYSTNKGYVKPFFAVFLGGRRVVPRSVGATVAFSSHPPNNEH